MMLGHIMGIPVEETVLPLATAGAAALSAAAIVGRARIGRMLDRMRRR
jgi:hypothetical protein